jgi:hypothetical protein
MVDIDVNRRRNNQGEVIVDEKDIKELEGKWKPTGTVQTDFIAGKIEYMHDGPIEDEKAK